MVTNLVLFYSDPTMMFEDKKADQLMIKYQHQVTDMMYEVIYHI